LVALASNLAFIAYAYLENLAPVLLLHALLLPVNACRWHNCAMVKRDAAKRKKRRRA